MAVTEALSALSTTAASNTPAGTDSIGTDLDDHLREIKKNVRFASNHPVQAAKITAYTVLATDHNTLLQVNATASAVTVTMLAAATAGDGFRVGVKRLNGNTNKVTVDGNSSEKIDTTLTSVLTTLNEVQWYVCDGSNWQTEADYKSYNVAKGSDIASATTPTIPTDGNYFDVTGTTTIDTFVVSANRHFFLQFDAALQLTHDATDLDLPSAANITTAAGDVAEFFSTGSNDVQCVNYTRANGTALSAVTLAAAQTWTAPQRGTVTDIGSQSTTVTVNLDTSNNHKVTLTGNAAFASPTGLDSDAIGQCGSIFIIQDAGGTNAPTFHDAFDFIGGTAPTMTSTGDAVDRLDYIVVSATRLQCVVTLAYS